MASVCSVGLARQRLGLSPLRGRSPLEASRGHSCGVSGAGTCVDGRPGDETGYGWWAGRLPSGRGALCAETRRRRAGQSWCVWAARCPPSPCTAPGAAVQQARPGALGGGAECGLRHWERRGPDQHFSRGSVGLCGRPSSTVGAPARPRPSPGPFLLQTGWEGKGEPVRSNWARQRPTLRQVAHSEGGRAQVSSGSSVIGW